MYVWGRRDTQPFDNTGTCLSAHLITNWPATQWFLELAEQVFPIRLHHRSPLQRCSRQCCCVSLHLRLLPTQRTNQLSRLPIVFQESPIAHVRMRGRLLCWRGRFRLFERVWRRWVPPGPLISIMDVSFSMSKRKKDLHTIDDPSFYFSFWDLDYWGSNCVGNITSKILEAEGRECE